MPSTFDPHYRSVLSMNDKDEPPNDAGILMTAVGKGTYIYTTLSFFRQLPAINPGAARLFVHLLAADRRAVAREVLSGRRGVWASGREGVSAIRPDAFTPSRPHALPHVVIIGGGF